MDKGRSSYNRSFCSPRMSSPHTERISRISEKISNIHMNLESSKQSQAELLDTRLSGISEHLGANHEAAVKKIEALAEQVTKLQRGMEEEKLARNQQEEQREKEHKQLDQKISERFNQELNNLRDIEKRMTTIIEDRTAKLRMEISRESAQREENIGYLTACLENDIPKLQESIRSEKVERERSAEALEKKVSEEMTKLGSMIAAQKKSREETEEAMLEMLKDMITRMKGDIEMERKDRESTEETLLGLLEETCTKLTTATQQIQFCLLYTSDAADDTPCVDLGGRRIIKKKKNERVSQRHARDTAVIDTGDNHIATATP
eukprot:TRINITY_DN22615_c0_g1_i2.p1 TRINITY_DN22615_c0_g1~~TRINITY_DN22615_c0_g1_i2.p1  ORF type:complete len:332 (-),score=74.65 TRINITY_DN22615_c0_g1_i2:18-977(-)